MFKKILIIINVKRILIINVQTKYMEKSVFKEILPPPKKKFLFPQNIPKI